MSYWDSDYEWEDEDFIVDDDGYVNVWVDGSCLRNGQPGARAGYGIVYNFDHFMYVFVVNPKNQSVQLDKFFPVISYISK